MVLVFVSRLSSIIAQPAVSALVDLCIHVWIPPPPDVLNWVTREASGGDDKIFHVKLLKRCTKTKNCRWALFMFPFEVLPFHSRLDDPTALDHKQ